MQLFVDVNGGPSPMQLFFSCHRRVQRPEAGSRTAPTLAALASFQYSMARPTLFEARTTHAAPLSTRYRRITVWKKQLSASDRTLMPALAPAEQCSAMQRAEQQHHHRHQEPKQQGQQNQEVRKGEE